MNLELRQEDPDYICLFDSKLGIVAFLGGQFSFKQPYLSYHED
jgi:hypothetical protein